MRRAFAPLLAVLIAACGGAPPNSAPSPEAPVAPITEGPLRIEPGGVNLGAVAPGTVHQASVALHNTGTVPIVIADVKSTCICTAPDDLKGRTIAPGASIPLNLTFSAPTELGERLKEIQVIFSFAGQTRHVAVPVSAAITMSLRATPPYVDALKGVTAGESTVESVDGRPFRIISAGGASPEYADAFDPARDAPRSSYRLRWHVPPRSVDACAGARLWWPIETDQADCPILPVRIRHECTGGASDPARRQRSWTFEEPIALLGAVRGGEPVEVEVVLNNASAVPIASVASLSPDARAELLGTEPRGKGATVCRVRFTPRAGQAGLLYAMVEFRSLTGNKDIAFIARVLPN